ncbi:MAG: hypothetical protein Q7R71_00890 [bacterium]|nr:hypothetical protein [bacterium]
MTKIMTPSRKPMTNGQIDKAVGHYRDLLLKHRNEVGSSEAVQGVLGQSDYLAEQLAVIRKRVEAVSNIIVRRVKVDRMRTPQAILDATGRKQYTDKSVVAAMPRGEGVEVDVHFFKLGRYISDADLDKEYELRGLKPADPYSQAAVNEADPTFADEHPNGTHWKDGADKWCFATFDRWGGGRDVYVYRYGRDWSDGWFFAGVRK